MDPVHSGEVSDAGDRAPPSPLQEHAGPTLTPQTSQRRQATERFLTLGSIDVERQCSVPLPEGRRCGGSLTCKRHSVSSKRAVAGRSAPYDQLLAAFMERRRAENRVLEEASR
ncbi:SCA7, zinc-binding domain-containing protein [Colletotrichum phormii]|uniref:SCA7, zinc-binding domain-containing protein n=1 Tax=Colletotrichum phormii TaxID=359342 RepID=A0AAI9ZS99_9PEZI|nr:SCA7, zinc-binding domain-containing protein [Colletotrichum phormii]KAK1636093.1 SCA7, zinc-binding domain-containing protein [Colletotrichum phormii]